MRWKLTFVLALLFAPATFAQTSSLAFSRNARTYETQHLTLIQKSLAGSCLSITSSPDGLACNPAMSSINDKASLGIEGQLSNGYSAISNVQKLLDGTLNQSVVDNMFAQGQIIQIEAGADVNFHSKYLSGQYNPVSLKGFSVVRNEADPDVDLTAVEDSGFTFQSGYEMFHDFYAGLQLRAISRKFIKERFKLVDLATQDGQDLLKPKNQTLTYLEPGFTYFLAETWRPRVSLMVANLGFVSKKYSELNTPTEAQVGVGISPPVYWGTLELSLDYRSLTYDEEGWEKLHFGALYHFGSMYLSGGVDSNGISGGVYYDLDKINAGIVYSTTEGFNQKEDFYTQTVYVQLGWQL